MYRVDLFSLDIEGAEEAVLSTIPWEEVDIDILMIEVGNSDSKAIIKIMENAGYKKLTEVGIDIIFQKKGSNNDEIGNETDNAESM